MEFVKYENGLAMRIGQLLTAIASSAKPDKSIMMDYAMADEVARLYPDNVSSDFEDSVRGEIIEWIMSQPKIFDDMKNAINAYWNERLN